MQIRLRLLVCAILSVFVLSLFAPAPSAADVDDYLVLGQSGSDLEARGFAVIDDYETFATAWLSASDVADLEANDVHVLALDHTGGRGAYRFDLSSQSAAIPDDLVAEDTEVFIVQFRGPVKSEWSTLLASKAFIYDYLPYDSFLVRIPGGAWSDVADIEGVRAIEPYHPAFKLAPELPTEGTVEATALGFLDVAVQRILTDLEAIGATPTGWATASREHVIDITIDASKLDDVARIQSISWIEPAYDVASVDNAESTQITQGGSLGTTPIYDQGVDGRSQKLSVCDTGANTGPPTPVNVALLNRLDLLPLQFKRMIHEMHDDTEGTGIILYNEHLAPTTNPFGPHRKIDLYYSPQDGASNMGDAADTSGHGTHTAGTIAGDAAPYGQHNGNDGVAFASKLLVCDITTGGTFNILNDYSLYWQPAYDRGARVNSNSWGSSHTNTYTEKARQHDAYVWDNRDFLILRSMGNTGLGSIRPEAVAKSAMGIGATVNGAGAETLAGFSTGGLTTDGRMKPNVVAPGDCLDSSYLGAATSYACLAGTSMSTPTVAGAAGLVRDYFERGFYPSGAETAGDELNPSSALVRAVLQVSGDEISGDRGESVFPNKAQGWGRVLLDDAMFFAGDARDLFVADEGAGLSTGGVATTTVTVNAGSPLRIMIAWSDQPGAAGANPAIVNDLNLRVIGPGGEVYTGNNFVGNQVPAGAAAPDARNVEEAVYRNAPTAGTYTIEVTGANVPSGPQPYALVITGDLA